MMKDIKFKIKYKNTNTHTHTHIYIYRYSVYIGYANINILFFSGMLIMKVLIELLMILKMH